MPCLELAGSFSYSLSSQPTAAVGGYTCYNGSIIGCELGKPSSSGPNSTTNRLYAPNGQPMSADLPACGNDIAGAASSAPDIYAQLASLPEDLDAEEFGVAIAAGEAIYDLGRLALDAAQAASWADQAAHGLLELCSRYVWWLPGWMANVGAGQVRSRR